MHWFKKISALLFGSFLIGTGINGFIIPYHLIDGGIIGISLLAKYTWGIQAGLTIILLSFPIYCIAWFYFRAYFYNSLHGMLLSSFVIDLLAPLKNMFHYPEPASSIIGGLLVGSGIGIMLRFKTTTGGADLLAQFISLRTRVNVGLIILVIDGLVVCLASQIISPTALLYSALTIAAIGVTTSMWTYQLNEGMS
ncbi:MAG TPA: YitT family protein [Bacillales bacterium]|nr:YitT family protein [Bacillales bacterium]